MQNAAQTTPKQSLYRKIRSHAGQIDTKIGRQLFGDDNPFTRHMRYRLQHNLIQRQSGYRPEAGPRLFDTKQMLETGYMIFENLYDPEIVKAISKHMTEAFDNPNNLDSRDGSYSFFLKDLFINVPEVGTLMTQGMYNSLCDYYQSYFDITNAIAWRNLPPDENARPGVYSSSWHCDRRAHTMMKLFYLVNDTTEKDGPFHIMERGHSKRIIRTEYTQRLKMDKLNEQKEKYIKLTGKAGTVLIGNTTHCLHRAGLPEPGRYRDIIQLIFFPSAKPLDPNWTTQMYRCDPDQGRKGV